MIFTKKNNTYEPQFLLKRTEMCNNAFINTKHAQF